MPPLPVIQTPASTERRKGFGTNFTRYEAKRVAMRHHEPVILFPGELIYYLIDRQGIKLDSFNNKLGCADSYFTDNVFNTLYNNGSRPMPHPLQEKMMALTGTQTSPELWMQKNFTPADAEGITIDMSRDITDIVAQYTKYSHYKEKAAANDVTAR